MKSDAKPDILELEQLAQELRSCVGRPRKCLRVMGDIWAWPDKAPTDEHDRASEEIWNRDIGPTLLVLAKPDNHRKVREEALSMLSGSSDEPEVVRLFVDSLHDCDSFIRAAAASYLSPLVEDALPDEIVTEITQWLLELLSDESKTVRSNASYSLSSIAKKHQAARNLLLSYLQGPIPAMRDALFLAIMAADDAFQGFPASEQQPYVDVLLGILLRLSDDKAYACWKAGESLGFHIGGTIAFDALIQALRSPYACGRHSAVHGLMDLKNPAAIPYLGDIARHDRSKIVRESARMVVDCLSRKCNTPEVSAE